MLRKKKATHLFNAEILPSYLCLSSSQMV